MRPGGAPRLPCGESRRWARPRGKRALHIHAAGSSRGAEGVVGARGPSKGGLRRSRWPSLPHQQRAARKAGRGAPTRLRAYAHTRRRADAPFALRARPRRPGTHLPGLRPQAPGPAPAPAPVPAPAPQARRRKHSPRRKRRLRAQAPPARASSARAARAALCAQRVSGVRSAPAGGPVSSRALGNGLELPSSWRQRRPRRGRKAAMGGFRRVGLAGQRRRSAASRASAARRTWRPRGRPPPLRRRRGLRDGSAPLFRRARPFPPPRAPPKP